MCSTAYMQADTEDSAGTALVSGLALAIPLWVLIAGLYVVLVQSDPLSELQSAAFMAVMAAEAIAARCAFGSWKRRTAGPVDWIVIARRGLFGPTARQGLALAALAGAYLQYYFLDVSLQIAALPALQVFVPIAAVG